jgi:hypothetical protein
LLLVCPDHGFMLGAGNVFALIFGMSESLYDFGRWHGVEKRFSV